MAEITLLLASGPGQPDGDLANRLELSAPLTPLGLLDEAAYGAAPWPTRRLLPDGRAWTGEVLRTADGWALQSADDVDAPLWDLLAQILRPGEYVTLRRPDGIELMFRVVEVQSG
jgi:hypothetical protein